MIASEGPELPLALERGPGACPCGVEWGRMGEETGKVSPAEWRGRVTDLAGNALTVFWAEAAEYARWEIGHYATWQGRDEPVLVDGYDAESVVQAAFERLIQRETGAVQILYTAEDIRRELRSFIKHRVRALHERSETGLVTGEWDVLPPRREGDLVSVFDCLPGRTPAPDDELMRREKEKLLEDSRAGLEATLGRRKDLLEVFRRVWDGEKRREIARRVGAGVGRVKASRAQLRRRLREFRGALRREAEEIFDSRAGVFGTPTRGGQV